MVDQAPTEGGDPFAAMDPEMAADPHPIFEMLRESDTPVMQVDGAGTVLTTKAHIEEALKDPERFTSNMSAIDLANVRPLIPLQIDPPDQRKYRKLLDPIFAPREVIKLEEDLTKLVNDLIDQFIDQDEIDFAKAFSVPFPSQVFLTLLGMPLEDLHLFVKMKDGIIRPDAVTGTTYGSDEMRAYQRDIADQIYAYFNKVLDLREEKREDDLLSMFLDAEVDGDKLTRNDILDICYLFLIAGLDTVTASLDCMFSYLAQHPDRRQQIIDDPTIIPAAVEEMLRHETPVMAVVRAATQDTEIGGCPIKAGEQVITMLISANDDRAEFPDADVVRFDRETNRHIAFGAGVHRCLGSHLARAELRIALREWHRRIPNYEVKDGHTLEYTAGIRSIEHFPMVIHPAKDA